MLISGVLTLGVVTAVVLVSSDTPQRAPAAPPPLAHRGTSASSSPPTQTTPVPSADVFKTQPWLLPPPPGAVGHLRPGSQPAVLPSSVLIADKLNNRLIVVDALGRLRWQFPNPGDLAPGQTFRIPDDAFFSPDGRYIVATQEDDSVISVIDVATHHIVFRYGVPGRPGITANRLSNPDDAMLLPGGTILTADIKNCRLLLIAMGTHQPQRVIGTSTTACLHHPPTRWGSPNGAFPMGGGRYLVTEINGDWVDAIDLTGKVYWSMHPPQVAYPSDSNQIAPDRYLTVDYAQPGQIVIFNRAGRTLWRFRGSGRDVLNHPSLGLPLPNGDIVVNDDFNHRVIVVDPRTNRIVWQYGHTRSAGRGPGYLNNPDGVDLVPPHSLLTTEPISQYTPSVRFGSVRAV